MTIQAFATVMVPEEHADRVRKRVAVEVDPDALYPAEEAAVIIGSLAKTRKGRMNTMYPIPERQLPRVRRGPNGGRVWYRGRDLLNYRNGKTYLDG